MFGKNWQKMISPTGEIILCVRKPWFKEIEWQLGSPHILYPQTGKGLYGLVAELMDFSKAIHPYSIEASNECLKLVESLGGTR